MTLAHELVSTTKTEVSRSAATPVAAFLWWKERHENHSSTLEDSYSNQITTEPSQLTAPITHY
jgi:hypothetical protein